jgi:hypothetical protein
VHLVPAAELPGDGVEAKADGLTEEVPELVNLSESRSWFRGGLLLGVALSSPFMGRWRRSRRRGRAGWAGRLEHL